MRFITPSLYYAVFLLASFISACAGESVTAPHSLVDGDSIEAGDDTDDDWGNPHDGDMDFDEDGLDVDHEALQEGDRDGDLDDEIDEDFTEDGDGLPADADIDLTDNEPELEADSTEHDSVEQERETEEAIEGDCSCAIGPCCDGCLLLGEDHVCQTRIPEYRCSGEGCGDDVEERYKNRYCDGVSSECLGRFEVATDWAVLDDCDYDQRCHPTNHVCEDYVFHDQIVCDGLDRKWSNHCGVREDFIENCADDDDCTRDTCSFDGCANEPYTCNGNGACNPDDDICTCNHGLTGDYCDKCQIGYQTYPDCDHCAPGYIGYPDCYREMVFVSISGGTFQMGCVPQDERCYPEESPRHEVSVSSFEMTETEITNSQFVQFLNENGNTCGDGECVDSDDEEGDLRIHESGELWMVEQGFRDHPVNEVTWYGAKTFCEWAGGRLPSEAEWEYAARAGADTIYSCGDDVACLDGIAWHSDNSCEPTPHCIAQLHPVRGMEPNDFGLYDMFGNVWEWNEDLFHDSYEGAPSDGSAWEDDQSTPWPVLRGGSVSYYEVYLRASARMRINKDFTWFDYGFRCARNASSQ